MLSPRRGAATGCEPARTPLTAAPSAVNPTTFRQNSSSLRGSPGVGPCQHKGVHKSFWQLLGPVHHRNFPSKKPDPRITSSSRCQPLLHENCYGNAWAVSNSWIRTCRKSARPETCCNGHRMSYIFMFWKGWGMSCSSCRFDGRLNHILPISFHWLVRRDSCHATLQYRSVYTKKHNLPEASHIFGFLF